jgi:isopenicillin N synthase-like dioxygenase
VQGYTGIRQETLDASLARGDLKESFYMGPLAHRPQDLPQPFDAAENRAFVQDLQKKLHDASLQVLGGLATALGLQRHVFQSCHTSLENRMRYIHYPAMPGEIDE